MATTTVLPITEPVRLKSTERDGELRTGKLRVDSIDLLRGLVMVIIMLDG